MATLIPFNPNQLQQIYPQGQQGETGVVDRLINQFNRIGYGEETGQINPWQAQCEERQDMRVFGELGRDLNCDGGDLSAEQTYQLGQQLNGISGQIGGYEQGEPYQGPYLPTEGVGSGPNPECPFPFQTAEEC